MTDERRNHERSPIEMAASYGIPDADDITQDASLINMSGIGFCFETENPLEKGEKLTLNLDLENKKPIFLDVKVIWVKPIKQTTNFLIGVKILKTSGKDYQTFLKYYQKNL